MIQFLLANDIFFTHIYGKSSLNLTVNMDEIKLEEIIKKLLTKTENILDKKLSKLEKSVNGITDIRKDLKGHK